MMRVDVMVQLAFRGSVVQLVINMLHSVKDGMPAMNGCLQGDFVQVPECPV